MDNTAVELKFREVLFRKYSQCEKHLLPRDDYYQTISELKLAAAPETKKSRHQYLLLSKYEILQCGDVEKVQVGKDQEQAQSEKDSHSKNRGGKKPN